MTKLFAKVFISLQLSACTSLAAYPPSDHFDGARFFNPDNTETNSLWDALKLLSTDYEAWPAMRSTTAVPDVHRVFGRDDIAITFINHATVLIQSQGLNVLADPVWSERVSPVGWLGPKRHRAPGIALADLPRIDAVVISHNHYDHMDLATLQQLDHAFHPIFLVPLGNKALLENAGIGRVLERDWWQSFDLSTDLKFSLTPSRHNSGRGLFDKDKSLWGSYVIGLHGHTVYFAGDTAYSPHFRAIRDRYGAPDIALLPIGAYAPRWFMQKVHMNPDEAVQAHRDLGARQSIGIHFGTFQLTSEGIDQPATDLQRAREKQALTASDFLLLAEGQTRIFRLTPAADDSDAAVQRGSFSIVKLR